MNIEELMNEVQNLVNIRSDPNDGYFYVNDSKQVRFEKIFDIPSMFKRNKANDYTQEEMEIRNHRENIENYFNPQKNFDQSIMAGDSPTLMNEEEAKYNFYLENIFKLQERDPNKGKNKNENDEKTYQFILQQLSSFSEKIEKSYAQIDQEASQEQQQVQQIMSSDNHNLKLLNDAETNINQLKSMFSKQKEKTEIKKDYDKLTVQ